MSVSSTIIDLDARIQRRKCGGNNGGSQSIECSLLGHFSILDFELLGGSTYIYSEVLYNAL